MTPANDVIQGLVWYAVRVRPGRDYAAIAGLKERGFDTYIAEETRWKRTKLNKRERQNKPLIPGLVFVGVKPWGPQAHECSLVEAVADVVRFVSGEPAPIRPEGQDRRHWVYSLQAAQAAGEFDHTPARKFSLKKGDKARVLKGPFKGQIGELLSADDEGRVRLMLEGLFKGGIALDGDAIEPAIIPKAA